MRNSTIVMIAFAVVFGLLAVFVAQTWLNSQAEMRMKSLEAQKKPIATRTIVVAAKPLRFGNELTPEHLREMPWPETALPNGSFAKIADLLSDGKRVVLTPIEIERAGARQQDHRRRPARHAVGAAARRTQGRHHPRQRCRRRRAASCCRAIASMSC